jgi:predicted DNA-binding transcriptional regulator AlpA
MRPHNNQPVRAIVVSPQEPGLKLDELLDRKTVAKLLGISPATLKTWVCERKGPPFYKMGTGRGSRVYYQRSDVEEWLNRHAIRVEMKD